MRRLHLSDVIDTAVSVLEDLHAQVGEGAMSEEEATAEALGRLSVLRYGESGQFFAYDGDHIARVIPTKLEWIGTDKSDVTDINGVRIVNKLVHIGKTEGRGLLTYHFNQPGSDAIEPKIRYILRLAPWDWVVGKGSFLADIEADLAALQCIRMLSIFIRLAVLGGPSVLLLRSVTQPISQGDLSTRIEAAFPGDYERFRLEINAAIEKTAGLVASVDDGANTIRDETDTLTGAATEMRHPPVPSEDSRNNRRRLHFGRRPLPLVRRWCDPDGGRRLADGATRGAGNRSGGKPSGAVPQGRGA